MTALTACNLLKTDCEYSIKVLVTTFFIEQLCWLPLNYVLVSEKTFLKKEVIGKIAFELISLFDAQIQQPTSRSTTTRAFVFLANFAEFYYYKILGTI